MRFKSIFLIALILFIGACATEYVEKAPEMYWPIPPEKPRIKFVDMIVSSQDVKKSAGLTGFFFGKGGDVKFVKPYAVAVNRQKVYVTDIGGIFTFDFSNNAFGILGTDQLRLPTGIVIALDNIYVAESVSKRIFQYELSGKRVREFGVGIVDTISGIAADIPNRRLIAADSRKHAVHIFDFEGKHIKSFGRRGAQDGEFNIPYGVAVDRTGRIYVVDSANFRIQIFTPDGKFLKSVGRVGTTAGNFARPKGVSTDSEGHIYVLDSAFGNFQIFDYDGNTLLAVGSNGTGPAEFQLPSSIFIDENDKIYVVDQVNKRVQIFQYLKDGGTL